MRQVVPENHPEPIGACRTTRVQTAIWQSPALRRSKALSHMVFGIRHFPCHFCKVVPSMRFGSETGVSIYCYPPAGFQLKPATIEILCAPRCGRPVRPSIFPAGGPAAALSDVFFPLQKLPTLSHKANACGISQLSTLSEWVCEIAVACSRKRTGRHDSVLF